MLPSFDAPMQELNLGPPGEVKVLDQDLRGDSYGAYGSGDSQGGDEEV